MKITIIQGYTSLKKNYNLKGLNIFISFPMDWQKVLSASLYLRLTQPSTAQGYLLLGPNKYIKIKAIHFWFDRPIIDVPVKI